MSSQPPSRTRQRRQRYSGITQPRSADFVEDEAVPSGEASGRTEESWVESEIPAAASESPGTGEAAGKAEIWPAEEVASGEPREAQRPDRSELLAAAEAHTRDTRRAGTLLDEVTPASPWSVGQRTRFKLLASLAILLAAGGGFFLGSWMTPGPSGLVGSKPGNQSTAPALTAQLDAQALESGTSAAFSAMKQRRFSEARSRFASLLERNPQMKFFTLEIARSYVYEGNFLEAQRLAEGLTRDPNLSGEAYFILGLVQLTERNFAVAASSFRNAVGASPLRADAYYMLAEAQRRAGKVAGSSELYQAALDRNQVETNELTYRLKLWIARIQDDTMPAERLTELAQSLARPNPGSEPLVVEAARLVKAGDVAGAARRLEEAGRTMEPLLFRVVLMDPFFSQEAWRPEMVPIYKR